jgi:hypothetical protein
LAAHEVASDVLANLERSDSEYPTQTSEPTLTIPAATEETTPSSEDIITPAQGDMSVDEADADASSTIDVEDSPTQSTYIIRTHVSALFGAAPAEDDANAREHSGSVSAGGASADAASLYAPLEGFEDSPDEARMARQKLKVRVYILYVYPPKLILTCLPHRCLLFR